MSGKPISNIGLGSGAVSGNACANDPFNYPMPNRSDLMSLQTMSAKADGVKTNTNRFTTSRVNSTNLWTNDIQGKFKIITDQLFISELFRRCTKAPRLQAGEQA